MKTITRQRLYPGIPVLSLKGFAKFSRVYTRYAVAAFFVFLARAVEVSSALLTSIHTYIYQHCTRVAPCVKTLYCVQNVCSYRLKRIRSMCETHSLYKLCLMGIVH